MASTQPSPDVVWSTLTFGWLAPLRSYLTDLRPGEDPPLWPEFEHQFWRYARQQRRASGDRP